MFSKRSKNLALMTLLVASTLTVLAALILLKSEASLVQAQGEGNNGPQEIETNIFQDVMKNHIVQDSIDIPGTVIEPHPEEVTGGNVANPLESKESPLEAVGPVKGTVLGSSLEVNERQPDLR